MNSCYKDNQLKIYLSQLITFVPMINNNLLESCAGCYASQLSEYPASLTINAGLAAGVNYIVKATDKFGNRFSTAPIAALTNGSLVITIPQSFPQQWFNRNAGSFLFQVSETADPWVPVSLTLGGSKYTCILVDFIADPSGLNIIA